MAKEKFTYAYPSRFGSHSVMIHEEETGKLTDPKLVVILDEYGTYTTERNRLDNGLADPNRYASTRMKALLEKSKKEKKDN